MRLAKDELDVIVDHLKTLHEESKVLTEEDLKLAAEGLLIWQQMPDIFKDEMFYDHWSLADFEKCLKDERCGDFNAGKARRELIITAAKYKTIDEVFEHYGIK